MTGIAFPPEHAQTLEQLRDIYVPMPDAGFGISRDYSATGLLILLVAIAWWLIHRHLTQSPRRIALKELNKIQRVHRDRHDTRQTLSQTSALLRRLAIVLYRPGHVAGLTGEEWLTFLDDVSGGTFFTKGEGRALGTGAFVETPPTLESEAFFIGVRHWLQRAESPSRTWRDKLLRPPKGLPPLYRSSHGQT